jgi:hypothetical protein
MLNEETDRYINRSKDEHIEILATEAEAEQIAAEYAAVCGQNMEKFG